MKNKLTYSLLLAAASCGVALGQTTAYTTPVGYMTVPIPAGGTTVPGQFKLQIGNQGLLPGGGPAYAGAAEAYGVDVTGFFVQDDQGTSWVAGTYGTGPQYSHVVEVTSGPMTGSITYIKSSVATKLYTLDDLSGAGAGATFKVWKTFTIASLLGDPPMASVMGGGTNISDADNFLVLDPMTKSYVIFWYKNGGIGGTGWRANTPPLIPAISNANAPGTSIFPNDGYLIERKQASVGSLVISGAVKPGVTKVRVEGDGTSTVLNVIATQVPVDQIKFKDSNLYTGNAATGVLGSTNISDADNVLIFDADTNKYKIFWYKNGGIGGTGWRVSAVPPIVGLAEDFVIPSTGSVLINRKSGPAFSWTVPAVVVSPQ